VEEGITNLSCARADREGKTKKHGAKGRLIEKTKPRGVKKLTARKSEEGWGKKRHSFTSIKMAGGEGGVTMISYKAKQKTPYQVICRPGPEESEKKSGGGGREEKHLLYYLWWQNAKVL